MLKVRSSSLEAIIWGANLLGMFLYARLVCDTMVLKSSIDGMEEAIDDLPKGLDEA